MTFTKTVASKLGLFQIQSGKILSSFTKTRDELVKLNELLEVNIVENEKQVASLQEEIIQLDLLKGQHKKVILNIDAFLNN